VTYDEKISYQHYQPESVKHIPNILETLWNTKRHINKLNVIIKNVEQEREQYWHTQLDDIIIKIITNMVGIDIVRMQMIPVKHLIHLVVASTHQMDERVLICDICQESYAPLVRCLMFRLDDLIGVN
jgi:hypothetical protein